MKVKINGFIKDGFSIEPITDDEETIEDFSHLCGFNSLEEAKKYCYHSGFKIEEIECEC